MRTRYVLTATFLLGFASAALAQDPPSLPALTDPVAIGRSEITGKWYGTVDFGARASTVDGDEARCQRYRDLRSGVYANTGVAGRRTADWTFEAQAWNIGYRDQRYQLDCSVSAGCTGTFLWDQIPLWISGDTRTLYTETQPGVFRLEDSMQQTIQAGTGDAACLRGSGGALRPANDAQDRPGRRDVQRHADVRPVLHFKSTNRDGAIPFGGTFGFSNAVEIPAPVTIPHHGLQDRYEWANSTRALLRVGWDGSDLRERARERRVGQPAALRAGRGRCAVAGPSWRRGPTTR